MRMILLVAAAAVAGYFLIRWYEGRQSAQYGNTQGGAGLGSNLNSVAPELIGGSTGPSIGPALSTPVTINVTSSAPPESANPVGSMVSANNVVPSSLALANPENSATGAQASAPQSEDMSGAGVASAATGPTYMTPMSAGVKIPNSTNRPGGKPAAGPDMIAVDRGTARPIRRPGVPKRKEKEPA